MIEGLIFDMDGILVDTEPFHFQGYREALKDYGIGITEAFYNDFWIRQGKGIRDFIREKGLDIDPIELRSKKRAIYHELVKRDLKVCKGVMAKLDELSGIFPLAVYTMSFRIDVELIFKTTGIEKYFGVIVAGDNVKQPKPHPEGYLLSSAKLGIPPQWLAVIDDAEKGIKGGREPE